MTEKKIEKNCLHTHTYIEKTKVSYKNPQTLTQKPEITVKENQQNYL